MHFRKILEKRFIQHIIFWLSYLVLFTIIQNTVRANITFGEIILNNLLYLIVIMPSVYINIEILFPHILKKKRYIIYAFLLVVMVLTMSFIATKINGLMPSSYNFEKLPIMNRGLGFLILINALWQSFFIAITSFLHFLKQTLHLQDVEIRIKELESINYRTKLDLLKAQINSHFLISTLNNIYSHSLLEKKQVPDMILKLSDLMNYILYECREEKVPLSKEIEFVSNYIDLEKVRVDESFKININCDLSDNNFLIAPLIFITFLENAFKHVVNIEKGNPYVNISIMVIENNVLDFFVENSTSEFCDNTKTGGVGLDNVKKRLGLIYPNKHRLDILNDKGKFKVNLIIKLDLK